MDTHAARDGLASHLAATRTAWSMATPEVVTLPAHMDPDTAGTVRDALHSAIDRAVVAVITDMTQTRRCDYLSLHALIEAIRLAAAGHVELRIVLPDRAVRGALQVMGLDNTLEVYATVESALTG